MISACVACQPVSSCSQLQPVHWAIAHWQHRHHEPRTRSLSLAETRSLHLPPPPFRIQPPPTSPIAVKSWTRADAQEPSVASCSYLTRGMLYRTSLNRISFPFNVSNWFPQRVSFNVCFETINMNWIRNKLHFVFTCSWLKRIGRN